MIVRDAFKVAWLTHSGYKWQERIRNSKGEWEYIFSGSLEERKCLNDYSTKGIMPIIDLKAELQNNKLKSQEFTTNGKSK